MEYQPTQDRCRVCDSLGEREWKPDANDERYLIVICKECRTILERLEAENVKHYIVKVISRN